MIHFKNHNPGLSFIEVIVALMIVSVVLIASFKTQASMLRAVTRTVHQINIVTAIKNYFVEAVQQKFIEKNAQQEQTLSFPAGKLTYQATVAKDASVFKNISGIMIEKVTAQWNSGAQEHELSLVAFTYKAPKKEEKPAPAGAKP